jgi:hypothetical protein
MCRSNSQEIVNRSWDYWEYDAVENLGICGYAECGLRQTENKQNEHTGKKRRDWRIK